MAEIVAALAATHSPGLLGWFDDAPEAQQRLALECFAAMRRHLRQARPDVLIIFANDHLLNWPLANTPDYTVGIGAEHTGPADWYQPWLDRPEKYRVPGHPALARYLVNAAAARGVQMAFIREDMQFDDGISTPLYYLNPQMDIATIPVTMNCTVPPIPTPHRAYAVGRVVCEILQAYPGDERIALIGSGGLSHEPGGPRYFFIDEAFDRWFLDSLAQGSHDTLLRECTLERMEEAGSGGTAELLAWLLVLAATTGPAEVLGYCAAHAWRSGAGWVIWPQLLAQRG